MENSGSTPYEVETLEYTCPSQTWHEGTRWSGFISHDVFKRLPDFPVHEDDVFICGYPKSGNVWVTTIVSGILHQDDLDTWKQEPATVPGTLLDLGFDFALKLPRPTYFYTHMPYHMLPTGVKDKQVKIVHISRDPKDVAVSFFHFHRNLTTLGPWKGPWDVFYDNFISGQVLCGSYFNNVRTYWEQKDNPNVMNIRYENLKRDPKTWVCKLSEFLGKPLDPEKLEKVVDYTSFSSMKDNPSLNPEATLHTILEHDSDTKVFSSGQSYFRKGTTGDWTRLFTEAQRRQIDGLYRQLCKDLGMEVESD